MDDLTAPAERSEDSAHPELRHFTAFQQVYLVRDYTAAGHDLNTNRKGILRMMERLEQVFRNPLFTEPRRGVLVPSPFADRLYNDLRFLTSARDALSEQVAEIRTRGRPVRIGGSPIIFRTTLFRSLFRDLQISGKVRASYVPVQAEDTFKALTTGVCDLHIGCSAEGSGRFATRQLDELRFRMLERRGNGGEPSSQRPWIVSSGEMRMDILSGEATGYRPLDEAAFLHWMDHPEVCPAGTHVFAPEIPFDDSHWSAIAAGPLLSIPVHLRYLRQHPYEFLPALANGIHLQITPP